MQQTSRSLRFSAATTVDGLALNAIFRTLLGLVALILAHPFAHADELATIGWGGHYRVGKWTGVRINPNELETGGEPNATVVETRDGESVRVRYGSKTAHSTKSGEHWIYVVPGGEAVPLTVIHDGKTVARQRFPIEGSPAKGPSLIPRDMPWIVVFGDSLEMETIGANDLLGRDASVFVSKPTVASKMPNSHLGYDAVDVVMVNSAGLPVLTELDQAQRDAIVDWVHGGGRFVVTLGADSKALIDAAPWLHRLLPFEVTETVRLNPSDIETFTSTQSPLEEFVGVSMPRKPGVQRLIGRTVSRVSAPIAMEYHVGFGSVVAIAADLHAEPFKSWPDRMTLISALVGPSMLPYDESKLAQSRLTAYDDLSGQLRASLDQFAGKKSLGFSAIALILMALIALVGPLDYLLVNRWLGKPILGWLTFPVAAIGLSGILVWQANQHVAVNSTNRSISPTEAVRSAPAAAPPSSVSPSSADSIETKQVELIDIDSLSGRARGNSIHFAYTHHATIVDLAFHRSQPFNSIVTKFSERACPFGYPGESFGGIQIAVEDSLLPAYQAVWNQSIQDGGELRENRLLTGVPLAPRSSKGFLHSFDFQTNVRMENPIEKNTGSEYLKGAFVNPLPVDILDGFIVFGNWTYLLPTRLPAGERVAKLNSLRQKNFRFYLSRRKTIENSSEGEAWQPGVTEDLERLMQILMFHEASGGNQYTRLRNQVFDSLDLSNKLVPDRCLLVGRLGSSMTSLELETNQRDSANKSSESLAFVRVILPVVATKAR